MKLNRRKLKSLIAEELKKLNEGNTKTSAMMEEVLKVLKTLPEPFYAVVEGDKIVCYSPSIEGDDAVEFEVIFK